MAKISQKPVTREVREEMFRSMFRALARVSDEGAIGKILDDVLTPTEKIMIAKRVMAAILIDRGYSYTEIGELLKLSPTTINTVHREIRKKGDGYRLIFGLFPKKSKFDKFLVAVDRFLALAIPPVKGSKSSFRRWKRG
ncbi:MAG: hypothetical protein HYT42_01040 [Candidatus Sungbacteria bacterium]|nr:hypothetical protein [Candidatus Sungbacteria bacterium]